jgi:hypothetical protein
MKDLGPIHFFLGIQVLRTKDGFFLNQAQYVEEILDHVGMVHCKPAVTPVDTKLLPRMAIQPTTLRHTRVSPERSST